jgi:hypothetical protein
MKTLLVVLGFCIGCRTEFTGSPHIDPATCQAKCAGAQLQFVGMVYMGEYSSACICDISRPPAAPPTASGAGAGAGAAAAGVVMQMRAQQEQRARQAGH